MACCERLRSRCKGSARSQHGSVTWRGLRRVGGSANLATVAPWLSRKNRSHGMRRAARYSTISMTMCPRAFGGLCDDEGVPLICPTCQVSAQSVLAGDRLLLCMGFFSIFLVGSHSNAARLRESCLKPHTRARPLLYRSAVPEEIRTP